MNDSTLHTVCVEPSQAGTRLDKWLSSQLADLSRVRIQGLIANGAVSCGAIPVADASRKTVAGEIYSVCVPEAAPAAPEPERIDLSIVFEDEHLIVIDKPAGMVVHPAPGNMSATLVNALLHHCTGALSGINGVKRPGIVHRLDKDTSGLLVVAKNDMAHQGLAKQFAEHSIVRAYRAVCWGVPVPVAGEIEGDIGRHPIDRKKMAIVTRGGKSALTRYRVERGFGEIAALVQCRLATGRTHQIRVHMASIGHPLIGDTRYGRGRSAKLAGLTDRTRTALLGFPRQALHAFLLGFIHPVTGETLRFESKIPSDFNNLTSLLEVI